jgi:hypothetical protein
MRFFSSTNLVYLPYITLKLCIKVSGIFALQLGKTTHVDDKGVEAEPLAYVR